MIVDKINQLFETYDGLIMPASGGIAPKFGMRNDQLSDRYLLLENHLAIGNFGGFPSITIPSAFIDSIVFPIKSLSLLSASSALNALSTCTPKVTTAISG